MSDKNISTQKFLCCFCKKGIDVEKVCGKLHVTTLQNDKDLAAHHKCMQYSATLIQYKILSFGGFVTEKVLAEARRARQLKCAICKSNKMRVGGASAGCAIAACRKTFHYYCARMDDVAVTKRLEVRYRKSNTTKVLYRVFCTGKHEKEYRQKLTTDYLNQEDSGTSDDDLESVTVVSGAQSSIESTTAANGIADVLNGKEHRMKLFLKDSPQKHEDSSSNHETDLTSSSLNDTEPDTDTTSSDSLVSTPRKAQAANRVRNKSTRMSQCSSSTLGRCKSADGSGIDSESKSVDEKNFGEKSLSTSERFSKINNGKQPDFKSDLDSSSSESLLTSPFLPTANSTVASTSGVKSNEESFRNSPRMQRQNRSKNNNGYDRIEKSKKAHVSRRLHKNIEEVSSVPVTAKKDNIDTNQNHALMSVSTRTVSTVSSPSKDLLSSEPTSSTKKRGRPRKKLGTTYDVSDENSKFNLTDDIPSNQSMQSSSSSSSGSPRVKLLKISDVSSVNVTTKLDEDKNESPGRMKRQTQNSLESPSRSGQNTSCNMDTIPTLKSPKKRYITELLDSVQLSPACGPKSTEAQILEQNPAEEVRKPAANIVSQKDCILVYTDPAKCSLSLKQTVIRDVRSSFKSPESTVLFMDNLQSSEINSHDISIYMCLMKDISEYFLNNNFSILKKVFLEDTWFETQLDKYRFTLSLQEDMSADVKQMIQNSMKEKIARNFETVEANTGLKFGSVRVIEKCEVICLLLNDKSDTERCIREKLVPDTPSELFRLSEDIQLNGINSKEKNSIENESTHLLDWLYRQIDNSKCFLTSLPNDEVIKLESSQISVAQMVTNNLTIALSSQMTCSASESLIITISQIDRDVVDYTKYCKKSILYYVQKYSNKNRIYFVFDIGQNTRNLCDILPECLIDTAIVYSSGDPRTEAVSCVIVVIELQGEAQMKLNNGSVPSVFLPEDDQQIHPTRRSKKKRLN